jgi:hypothetical protein
MFYLLVPVVVSLIILMIVGVYLFYRGFQGMQDIDHRREELSENIESLGEIYEDIFNNE